MRDFEFSQALWAVVKNDGTFAGRPCVSWEEARELASQHDGAQIYAMCLDPEGDVDIYDDDYEPYYNEDMGFDPYMGCYTDDC